MGAADPTIAITVGVVLVLAIAVPAAVVLLFRNGWRVLPLAIGTIAGLIVGAALGELHWSGLAPRLGTLEHDVAGFDQKLDAIKKGVDYQPTRQELQKAFADARQNLDEKLRPLASGSELNALRGRHRPRTPAPPGRATCRSVRSVRERRTSPAHTFPGLRY
jgi:hypothetical protein